MNWAALSSYSIWSLSNNKLSGEIPKALGDLVNLHRVASRHEPTHGSGATCNRQFDTIAAPVDTA